MARYIWGVDSAQKISPTLYECVITNFSYPNYWGRYLTTVANASEGLTNDELQFMKSRGVKLLPIYNDFRSASGYREGQVAAQNAIFHARRLGIPNGTPIFANVERFFEVDSEWIRAWVETMYPSGYQSGFYHDPTEGHFNEEFCQASQENNRVRAQSILWSAEPDPGATNNKNAPTFNPRKVNCEATTWGWQYGRDSQACPIDTNLIDQRLFNRLPF
ncbi:glycoside hydrolase domain-containing protein [Calidifontibacillus oryziterrae]|uniref:glycoside hydrolase domain-containing protein n=1 Tax=Calidifontibacillus oryziterrae TaxID=1191699 RepID=UPI0002FC8F7B|nr:glycoside hydrolase domain-containing protein [Calidifontibacillus oryziterrae]